jgi:hypothetical protein
MNNNCIELLKKLEDLNNIKENSNNYYSIIINNGHKNFKISQLHCKEEATILINQLIDSEICFIKNEMKK